MQHRRAVGTMVLVTLLWSIAGVVTRHLEAARSFEVTFWRSAFSALALAVLLTRLRGPASMARTLREGGWPLWLSGLCWAVMYTAFMMAMTLTTVANVLVTSALTPLLTALIARMALGQRLATRTWLAIFVAGGGIAWMYAGSLGFSGAAQPGSTQVVGTLVAACVPVAAAINWVVLQQASRRAHAAAEASPDMLVAVLVGAVISSVVTLPLAWPFAASAHDLGLLAVLGVFQLAVPCLLAVRVARSLSAPEVSLLGLLETLFGVLWAWLGAGEQPGGPALTGGALVMGALMFNELFALSRPRTVRPR